MYTEKEKLEQIRKDLGAKRDAFVAQLLHRLEAAGLSATVAMKTQSLTSLRVEDAQVPTFAVKFDVCVEVFNSLAWSAKRNRVSCAMRGGLGSPRKYTRLDDKQAEKLVSEVMLARDRAIQKEMAHKAAKKLRDEAARVMGSELAGQVKPPGMRIVTRAPGQYRVVFDARVPGALLDTDLNADEVIRLMALLREIQRVDELMVIVAANDTYYEPGFGSFGPFPKAIRPADLEVNLQLARMVAENSGCAPVRAIAYSEVAAAAIKE